MVIDDPSDPLANLRFADDVLLVAQSSSDIRKMMIDFRNAAEKYGLTLHPGKTKVMTTHRGKHPSCISVGTGCIEVLDIDRAEMYLGRSVCLGDYHQSELRNRIKCGWAAFSK